jgi:hypothetical protein
MLRYIFMIIDLESAKACIMPAVKLICNKTPNTFNCYFYHPIFLTLTISVQIDLSLKGDNFQKNQDALL